MTPSADTELVQSQEKEPKVRTEKKKLEFSKLLLIQESVLIWIVTLAFIVLAFICVCTQSYAELPWLAAMAGFPWTAYGVSQMYYYKKSAQENVKDGIKYESVMAELNRIDSDSVG